MSRVGNVASVCAEVGHSRSGPTWVLETGDDVDYGHVLNCVRMLFNAAVTLAVELARKAVVVPPAAAI